MIRYLLALLVLGICTTDADACFRGLRARVRERRPVARVLLLPATVVSRAVTTVTTTRRMEFSSVGPIVPIALPPKK